MDKDVQNILIAAAILVVIGVVGIVALDTLLADTNFSTGFGFFEDEYFGLPLGWVASGVLLVIAVVLFYLFVWRKRS
jgi:uncharacterized membrane protein